MNRKDKSIEKLEDSNQDKNWTYGEVETLLKLFNFNLRNVKGSHFQYTNGKKLLTIAKHGKKARIETIKEIRRFLKEG